MSPIVPRPRGPRKQHFNIVAVTDALPGAGTMLLYGVFGFLDAYGDWQDDMADWYGYEPP
jgi:hypothetical protein